MSRNDSAEDEPTFLQMLEAIGDHDSADTVRRTMIDSREIRMGTGTLGPVMAIDTSPEGDDSFTVDVDGYVSDSSGTVIGNVNGSSRTSLWVKGASSSPRPIGISAIPGGINTQWEVSNEYIRPYGDTDQAYSSLADMMTVVEDLKQTVRTLQDEVQLLKAASSDLDFG